MGSTNNRGKTNQTSTQLGNIVERELDNQLMQHQFEYQTTSKRWGRMYRYTPSRIRTLAVHVDSVKNQVSLRYAPKVRNIKEVLAIYFIIVVLCFSLIAYYIAFDRTSLTDVVGTLLVLPVIILTAVALAYVMIGIMKGGGTMNLNFRRAVEGTCLNLNLSIVSERPRIGGMSPGGVILLAQQ